MLRTTALACRKRRHRTNHRTIGALAVLLALVAGAQLVGAPQASAHGDGSTVTVYNPVTDGDGDHNDVTAWWPWGADTAPAAHHIVYSNWGYMNDYSIDVFAKAAGRPVVTPFGSKTNTGHPVQSKVVNVRVGCRSGAVADGGYVVTVEARDTTTGAVLGRADLMHIASPRVGVGTVLGSWTTIGYTSQFRYSSCYQVSAAGGIHVHMELINYHRYACYIPRAYNQALTEQTSLGVVGSHSYGAQRARC
ncbi:MAG: hypothetical protein U0P45_14005 [Acidimicrobiales bacterium]